MFLRSHGSEGKSWTGRTAGQSKSRQVARLARDFLETCLRPTLNLLETCPRFLPQTRGSSFSASPCRPFSASFSVDLEYRTVFSIHHYLRKLGFIRKAVKIANTTPQTARASSRLVSNRSFSNSCSCGERDAENSHDSKSHDCHHQYKVGKSASNKPPHTTYLCQPAGTPVKVNPWSTAYAIAHSRTRR